MESSQNLDNEENLTNSTNKDTITETLETLETLEKPKDKRQKQCSKNQLIAMANKKARTEKMKKRIALNVRARIVKERLDKYEKDLEENDEPLYQENEMILHELKKQQRTKTIAQQVQRPVITRNTIPQTIYNF
jgi:hypothetical protein